MKKALPQFTLQRQPTGISAVAFVEGPMGGSQYLVTADRQGTVILWDLDVREALCSVTEGTIRELDKCNEPTCVSSGLSGVLSVQDATALLVEDDDQRLLDGNGTVAVLVQLRSQRLLLLRWTFVENELASAQAVLVWNVEQFGFCAATFARLSGDDSAQVTCGASAAEAATQRPRCVAVLVIPGEVLVDGTTSVVLHRIFARSEATEGDGNGTARHLTSEVWTRLVVGEAPIKYGQLMCLSLEIVPRAWASAATTKRDGDTTTMPSQDTLILTVSTESGHVGFALLVSSVAPSKPGAPCRNFLPNHALLRASAEPSTFCRAVALSHTRTTAQQHHDTNEDKGATPSPAQPCVTIACCTAEGRVQLFRVQPSSDGIPLASDVSPIWTMLWEYQSHSGLSCCNLLGSIELGDDDGVGGDLSALAVGGWDSSVAVLDTSCGTLVTSLEFHSKAVSSLASRRVATGGIAGRFSAAPRRVSHRRISDDKSGGGGDNCRRTPCGGRDTSWTVFSASEDGVVAAWRVDLVGTS